MTDKSSLRRAPRLAWEVGLGLLILSVAVYVALPRKPLYADNQNTKLLYGLAKADFGRLSEDWLIEQGSALPIFDALVYLTYTVIGAWGFHLWHFLAFAAYTVGVYYVAKTVGLTKPEYLGRNGRWFLGVFGLCWVGLNSNDATLKAFEGIAVQYVNAIVFETQVVGVLAVLALALFRLGQAGWASVLIVAAAWVHPPYALSGVILFAGMIAARWRCGDAVSLPPFTVAGGIVGCLAAAGFAYSLLQPVDATAQAEATRIIADIRIPYHTRPSHWLDDSDTYLKLAAIALAIGLAWRDPLATVMTVVVVCVTALTLWVVIAGDRQLALASPWRVSAIIVPAANAILLGRLIQAVAGWSAGNVARKRLAVGTAALAVAILAWLGHFDRFTRPVTHPDYFAWVNRNAGDGDQFLTPPGHRDFRLMTGQPQYVTWKTHPYRAAAVLEWFARLDRAGELTGSTVPSCDLLDDVAAQGVTHLVRPFPAADCPGWHAVYEDDTFVISELAR